jgi:hypothetical protein
VNDVNTKTGAQTARSRSYLASLPERTARAGAALAGGLALRRWANRRSPTGRWAPAQTEAAEEEVAARD